jgi:hypothetical protein
MTTAVEMRIGSVVLRFFRTMGPYGLLYHLRRNGEPAGVHDDPASARLLFSRLVRRTKQEEYGSWR